MNYLLSLEMITMNCIEIRHEIDIFGPKAPYSDY